MDTLHHSGGALPLELSSFVGRHALVGDIRRTLGASRLVTLTGPGGVGKTRIAIRVADELRAEASAVEFVSLAEVGDPDVVPDAVATSLGLGGAGSTIQLLERHLATRRTLLLLDNCEHLSEAVADLGRRLLAAAPGLRVLATSREPLRLRIEVAVSVPPMQLPPAGAAGADVADAEAVRLFLSRLMALAPELTLTDADLAAIAEICRGLDGVPLAVELAAAAARGNGIQALAQRVARGHLTLSADGESGASRQSDLRASLEWSYRLCAPAEQQLWSQLAVFVGRFGADAALAVAVPGVRPGVRPGAGTGVGTGVDTDVGLGTDAAALLQPLVDKSILTTEEREHGRTYRMLATVREYGRERLDAEGGFAAARQRHRDWYAGLLRRAEDEWFGPDQRYWLSRLRDEVPNIRAALERELSREGAADTALELIVPGWRQLWWANGWTRELQSWLDRILPRVQADSALHARGLIVRGYGQATETYTGFDPADLDKGRAMAARVGDRVAAAEADVLQSLGAVSQLDVPTAVTLIRRADALLTGADPVSVRMFVLRQLALIIRAGRAPDADERFAELLEQAAAYGDRYEASDLLNYTAGILTRIVPDPPRANELAARGAALRNDIGEYVGLAFAIMLLAANAPLLDAAERGARLIGVADTVVSASGFAEPRGYHVEVRGQAVELGQAALGDEGFAALVAEGRALTVEQGIGYAIEGRLPRIVARPAEVALTRREREVSKLVAQGLTNRQIASRLVISTRTAEGHVERLRIKFGVTSRAQIVSWVLAHADDTERVGPTEATSGG